MTFRILPCLKEKYRANNVKFCHISDRTHMKPKENPPCTAVVFCHSSCILVIFLSFSVTTCDCVEEQIHTAWRRASGAKQLLVQHPDRETGEKKATGSECDCPQSPVHVRRKEVGGGQSTVCHPATLLLQGPMEKSQSFR